MDLERIKQNFRIRSGRSKSKQQKKKPKVASPSVQYQEQQRDLSRQPNSDTTQPEPSEQATPEEQENSSNHHSEQAQEERSDETVNSPEDFQAQPEDHTCDVTEGPQETGTSAPDGTEEQTQQADSDQPEPEQHKMAEPSSEPEDFDLNPPKPRSKPPSLETISELLFSSDHLDCLLHYPPQLARFSAFLQKYIPQHHPLLAQYLETQKAIKAVAYANAIAEGLRPADTGEGTTTETRRQAATLDEEFEAISNASFKALVGEALPTFISYTLVKTVTECLTNEITGRSTPIMRDLVDGLSEVFCLTDPNQNDNPIIYASEEFYRLTRYGPEDTLNNNCRFLQGRKTNPDSPRRLKAAIEKGEEINETLLNYRRDGRPFINLLMVAPLHDKNGKLKYHIGAQVDVTGLIEGGRALQGFQRFLNRRAEKQRQDDRRSRRQDEDDDQRRKKRALARLRDLSETFDLEESSVVQANSRSTSLTRDDDDDGSIGSMDRRQRRVYGDSDASDIDDEDEGQQQNDASEWKLGQAGDGRLSGKLPGVYDSFMLIRPAPSLRIVFVSPKLRRIGNVLQTPFLSHVAAPNATLTGLAQSLKAGVPVSAKIHFTPERGQNRDGTELRNGTKHEDGRNGRAIWVSCTPLLGADDRVGVWMCVVVEKSRIGSVRQSTATGTEKQAEQAAGSAEKNNASNREQSQKPNKIEMPSRNEDAPIKPVRINSDTIITKPEDEKAEEGEEVAQADSPDNERSAKSIRQMQSVYFDASDGQEPESLNTDSQPDAEPTSPDAEPSSPNGNAELQQSTTHDAEPQAVEPPVEEYEESVRKDKSYDLQTPARSSPDIPQDSGEEYVNTRSPATEAQQNDRVVIEEDSDAPADENADPTSPPHGRTHGSRTPSPVLSPTSDIPPSIPSSAQLPDEDEDGGQEDDFETPRQPRYAQSVPGSYKDDESEHQDDMAASTATLRDESEDRNKSPDENHDIDRDSAISMKTPEKNQAKSGSPSPSASPAKRAHYSEDEGVDEEEYQHDVGSWVGGGPPSTKKDPKMKMDYFRAGGNRWSTPPGVGQNAGKGEDDRFSSYDDCIRSPVSVD
ncbi:hypothetical protein PMZ80_009887 [Knufia obscura]|uniref:PAC domain-containing protein n=1 Tax=Knufia obscura TaxID=1635080 RepID=A0ABR0RBW6_9EURO|nr:hypothetical protein PMZ80_009887 [Knufia obscura]